MLRLGGQWAHIVGQQLLLLKPRPTLWDNNGGLAVDGLSGRGLHDAVERGGVDAEGAGYLADGLTFVK